MESTKKWKCLVCGEVVEGETPPEQCPVCGVGPEMFEKLIEETEEKSEVNGQKIYKWKCTVCGEVVEGETPPEQCPVCGVGPEMFEKLVEETEEKSEINEQKVYKWKCTVCGEIVEGAEPPEMCPVCGVGPEYFVKMEEVEEAPVSDEKENIVIIGASGAGMGAAVEIRKRNKVSDITILSKEGVKGYYRPQLTKMLSRNDVTIEQLAIKTDDWFKENKVKLLLNKVVERIDTVNSKVILKDNEEIPYTKLIIASGAEVFVPPLEGRDKKGVFTLRYVKDGDEIKDYAKGKKTAAIKGVPDRDFLKQEN